MFSLQTLLYLITKFKFCYRFQSIVCVLLCIDQSTEVSNNINRVTVDIIYYRYANSKANLTVK